MKSRRVVITGIGTINPLGKNVLEYWKNLKDGLSGVDLITRFDASKFKTNHAAEIKNYNPTDYFNRKEARKLDLFAQFALIATEEAMQDSKLNLESINKDKAGVIWGSGIGGLGTFVTELRNFINNNSVPRFSPYFIPKMISDIASGHISIKYGFRGINYTTVSACASSTHAIIDAFNYIRMNKADIFITGGSEASINEAGIGGFNAMKAISTRNDDFKTASRPFDLNRDGFVMGEGGGALIVEEYEHAIKRGAKIYAEIIGGGMSADAYHLTAPHPEGKGAFNVMKLALDEADIEKEKMDYINTHGTSTPLGDIAEIKAIKKVFGEHAYKLNISSTKSMTGHLLGAAGAVESIACLFAINKGIIPPTINHFTDDHRIDNKLNFTFNKYQEREVNYALSNTFGFGGHNASVIFKKI